MARVAFRTFVVNEDGNRYVPYANQNGKRWDENWNDLQNDFNPNERVACARNWQGE